MITYTIDNFNETASTTEVTYTNEDGNIHVRTLNIPRLEDGTINQEYWEEILEGQLRGVENKVRVNAINFVDPDAESDDPTKAASNDTTGNAETAETVPAAL